MSSHFHPSAQAARQVSTYVYKLEELLQKKFITNLKRARSKVYSLSLHVWNEVNLVAALVKAWYLFVVTDRSLNNPY